MAPADNQQEPDAIAPPAADTAVPPLANYKIETAILFRRRGFLPAPGFLVELSESGALARINLADIGGAEPWPLHLRHGDELWLSNILDDPLYYWLMEIEGDLLRLRLFRDTGILPSLRALIARRDPNQFRD